MTFNSPDLITERDDTLIKGLCQAARTTRMELREWIEAELKDLIIKAELQEPLLQGDLKEKVERTADHLHTISKRDLPEAVRDFDDTIDDVGGGGYEDVYDAYDQLLNGHSKLIRIMRDLLELRSSIGEM